MEKKYIELTEKFWEFNESHHLSSSALLIYLFLLRQIVNFNSLRFSISDVYLSQQLGMTRKTIKFNKEKLQKYGLVKLDIKNGVSSSYELLTNYQIIQNPVTNITKDSMSLEMRYSRNVKFKRQNDKKMVYENVTHKKPISSSEPVKIISQKFDDKMVPTLNEFLKSAQGLEHYKPDMESEIKLKYLEWRNNGWKSTFNRPITNWKSALKNVLPYLTNKTDSLKKSLNNIPNIERITLKK